MIKPFSDVSIEMLVPGMDLLKGKPCKPAFKLLDKVKRVEVGDIG